MNRELLKNRKYVYLLSAQTVSNLGDWLNIVALMALIGLKWHASPLAVSAAVLCLAVPSIVFGSFAGTIADRFDRKFLMIMADVLRAVVVIGVVFSTQLWQVYLLLCIKSVFSALFEPAKEGKLKEIVKDDLMQPAVATSELVNNGAKIVGPILSGIFVAAVGIQWSFYLDSLSFLLSAFLLIGVPRTTRTTPDMAEHDGNKLGFFKQFTEGFVFLKAMPSLLMGLVVFSLVILTLQISDSQIIILLREIPENPIDILGYSMAASGAGMVIAAILFNKKEIRHFMKVLSWSGIFLGVAFILMGLLIHLPVLWVTILFPVLAFVMGFSFDMALIPFNVMVQKRTPEKMTGRVFGTISSVVTLASVIGMLAGGFISEFLGVIWTFVLGGSVLAVVGVIVYIIRSRFEGGKQYAEGQPGAHRKAEI
ncbi:MAG TPA: MFS transporter [Bacillales bacterium]|nr:MFS transporter [Bacillales bacterium]